MARMSITELRRTGVGVMIDTPVRFEWDGATHSMMQGNLEFQLQVKTYRTTPPGSEEPVEQILAVEWMPFDFAGEWRDHWAGTGFAMSTYMDFARLVGRTPLVRLEIDRLSFVGILTNLTISYRTSDSIQWKCTISPHKNETVGSFRPPEGLSIPAKPIRQRVDDAELAVREAVVSAVAGLELDLATDDAIDMRDRITEMEEAAARAQADASSDLGENPERQLFQLASDFRRIREAGHNAALQLNAKRSDVVLAFNSALGTLRANEWIHNTIVDSIRAAGIAYDGEIDMLSTAQQKPKAIHRVIDGENLERISARYYGTPDSWKVIFDANNLSTVVLEGGQELIIPERAA